ncbi:MAG TPA: MBL fold metallo-hydrolase, partial [Dehalococcoidales bacterium]|nr:MBL fold metallo-hydrolase [Dehalococcoidales bacterium]
MLTGKGIMRSNVYFVRSGQSWVLIDAGSVNCGAAIKTAAESLFGAGTRPNCILITHNHPDHAGSALELARAWNCTVYVHPDELEIAVNPSMTTFEKFANPMDRAIILPIMRLMPKEKFEAMNARNSLKDVCRSFDPAGSVPGLPDWRCVPLPGHTPGEVAFFRKSDRVLITGDAVVTIDTNSFLGIVSWIFKLNKTKLSGPPRYSTWNWQKAKTSVAAVAKLKPHVLATGHGLPL